MLTLMVWALMGEAGAGALEKRIRDYGYTPLIPASRLVPAGTLAVVTRSGRGVQLRVICTRTKMVGGEAAITSSAPDSRLKRKLKGRFNAGAKVLDAVDAIVGANVVKALSVSLTNVQVSEVPTQAVFGAIEQGLPEPSCVSARRFHAEKGDAVTFVYSTLEADVRWKIVWKANVDGTAKDRALDKMAAVLGASISSERFLEGDGLVWGVREDTRFATRSLMMKERQPVPALDPASTTVLGITIGP